MLISPSVTEIQLFKELTLKKFKVMGEVKVKGNNVSLTSYWLTSLWFHVNWPSYSWNTAFSKFDLKNSRLRSQLKFHKEGIPPYRFIPFSFHVNRPSHSWDTAISKFDIENSRSRSWVRSKFKVTTWIQHSINSHPFHSMSIGHPIPELQLFQNLTLKIKGQGHGWGQSWMSQHGSNIQSTHIPFVSCGSGIPFLSYNIFKIWPWK